MQDQIIHFLKKSDGYLSGEEISRQLNISRAGIWKYMQELRNDGYDIVAVPHLGYRLVSSPDKLIPREIQFDLLAKILGKKIISYESVNSTMDIAFRLGFEGAEEGTVVCAEAQAKGRGRLGRNWTSPKGKGIYFSVILRPRLSPSEVAQLTLLAAVAVSEAIQKVAGITAMIKWPNDLILNGKKLAGILTEMSADMDRVRFVVIGIGINVNTPASLLPPQATSLKQEAGRPFSRVALLQEVLMSVERWYQRLKAEGFSPITQRWKELSLTLGKRIRIVDPNGDVEGQAMDLDKDGGLIIRRDSGMIVKRLTGDVVQVK